MSNLAEQLEPIEMLARLGNAWMVTLVCLSDSKWSLRIQANPQHWDERFVYVYQGSLMDVITRAYRGEPDDANTSVQLAQG